jgi:pyruvate dehydrogenase E1 component alpha subunit
MGNRKKETTEPDPGSRVAADGKFALITNEKLISLYTNLLKCRVLSRQSGANGNARSMRGREAALVASTIDLGPGDAVCSREHGALTGFSDGAAIAGIFLGPRNHQSGKVRGTKAAGTKDASPSVHTHAAVGAALAHKTRVNRKIALVFASEETDGMLGEALHIAVTHMLPMVFVHQPDGDVNRGRRKPAGWKDTPWFPDITVDRDDVVAIYRVANEAISRARLGRGPTFIECVPFRVNGDGRHGHDPIRNMEHYLRARDLYDSKIKVNILAQLQSR